MTAFEEWQVGLGIVTACLLLAAFLGALYVGLKQNEINQHLLDLQYNVSVEVTYDNGRLNIANKGTTNLFLWGAKTGTNEPMFEDQPRLITPGGYYYIDSEGVHPMLLNLAKNTDGRESLSLEIYVETANRRKWTVDCLLKPVVIGDEIQVYTQTVALRADSWGGK